MDDSLHRSAFPGRHEPDCSDSHVRNEEAQEIAHRN